MTRTHTNKVESRFERPTTKSAQARTVLLVVVCFVLGIGVGAFWYYRATHHDSTNAGETNGGLSEGTKLVLQSLTTPVEIRFYSLLDPVSTSKALRAFAGRVDRLLSEYERAADGKITLTRYTTRSDDAERAAGSDGIKAFNLDKGNPCYLGVVVIHNGQKETLSRLSPEWEAALESDLSRAIARVNAGKPAANSVAAVAPPPDAATITEVKRAIPNLSSVSVAEGTQILRAAALKQFAEVAQETEQRVKEAQQRISQTQSSNSEEERQAAVKQLRQIQTEQSEKLKHISAQLQKQIAALEALKTE
jgi:ABC-type uncharacterized transport system